MNTMSEVSRDRQTSPDAPMQPAEGDIAMHRQAGSGVGPGVVFCGGFHSNMAGNKAIHFEGIAKARDLAFTRFDYRGHGESAGSARALGIGHWLADTLSVIDSLDGPLVLVGSSMGAWMAVLAAERRPERVVGLLTLAAAPDFVTEIMRDTMCEPERAALDAKQLAWHPNGYGDDPWPIPPVLMDSGYDYKVLDVTTPIDVTATLIHGTADRDVPFSLSQRLKAQRLSEATPLVEIVDGDHRLSDPETLATLEQEFDKLLIRIQQTQAG